MINDDFFLLYSREKRNTPRLHLWAWSGNTLKSLWKRKKESHPRFGDPRAGRPLNSVRSSESSRRRKKKRGSLAHVRGLRCPGDQREEEEGAKIRKREKKPRSAWPGEQRIRDGERKTRKRELVAAASRKEQKLAFYYTHSRPRCTTFLDQAAKFK